MYQSMRKYQRCGAYRLGTLSGNIGHGSCERALSSPVRMQLESAPKLCHELCAHKMMSIYMWISCNNRGSLNESRLAVTSTADVRGK